MGTRSRTVTDVLSATGGATLTAAGLMAADGVAAGVPVAVTALLASAGVATTVPVVGWVIAGLAGLTAGSIVLVRAIRQGNKNRKDAIVEATAMGLAGADDIGAYLVKALKKGPAWRADETASLLAKIKKNPDRNGKARRKDVERLQFLCILDLQEQAAKLGNEQPTAPIAEIEKVLPAESDFGLGHVVGIGFALGILKLIFFT